MRPNFVMCRVLLGLMLCSASAVAQTQSPASNTTHAVGVSGLWILANFSYLGMRAQGSASAGWRIISFIFGFPGTLLTLICVKHGAERAYGVDLPRKP